jgi:hypothetical protein
MAFAVLSRACSALSRILLAVMDRNRWIASLDPSFMITSRSFRSSAGVTPGVLVLLLEACPGGGALAAACA